MSQAKLDKFSTFFDNCDTSGNGELTIQELAHGLQTQCNCKKSDDQIAEMFLGTDSNNDKKITKAEFLNECVEKLPRKEAIRCHLNLFFKEKDSDNSGLLEADEVKEILLAEADGDEITPEYVDSVIAKADTSGDGKVSLEELNNLLSED
ncbi:hypothetical protein LOTGIDRAFT_204915 [Lottia gigantea]|uniref:EF-hand domain-containing protein n=1 Tax=Lottia gigantea TaxID=225164 RepID=V3ZMZ0_LOTGI|nr:hypothetical protein LOTGIDRAFT_204915 [Lottia gigantea]ESO82201.1 hypothetical protein LOTGIDRAFT_204915 [Lottia gigantea]